MVQPAVLHGRELLAIVATLLAMKAMVHVGVGVSGSYFGLRGGGVIGY